MNKILMGLAALSVAGCVMNTIEAQTTPTNNRAIIQTAEALVAERMRDPEATRFRDEKSAYMTSAGDYIVCGTLNAKNAMGGYVGYKPYYVRIRNGSIVAFQIPSESDEYNIVLNAVNQTCLDAAAGKVMVSS